jgi:signal transduction histidine kinase
LGERLKLMLIFLSLITVGFIALNILMFFELKRVVEESIYFRAYSHYLLYTISKNYRGDENFLVSEQIPRGFSFSFRDPSDPSKNVYVAVREEYLTESIKRSLKRLFFFQFLLIFSLILVYQLALDRLWKDVEEGREFGRFLVKSISHKLGNFLAVQKTNLSLLQKTNSPQALGRIQRSIKRLEKDVSLILRLSEKELKPVKVWVDFWSVLENVLSLFEEEIKEKKFIFRKGKDLYLYADERVLEDVLYNLLSNAIKYSKSFIHLRVFVGKDRVLFSVRNDFVENAKRGMGLGLKLLQRHAQRMDSQLVIRIKKHYTAHLCFGEFRL